MKIIRVLLILFFVCLLIPLLLMSCGTKPATTSMTAPIVARDSRVRLPELPTRVQIQRPGQPLDPNAKYVQFPSEVKPNGVWKAPADGGWVWNGKDLQALIYGLVEPWKWIDKTSAIVENHNQSVTAKQAETAKPWYKRIW